MTATALLVPVHCVDTVVLVLYCQSVAGAKIHTPCDLCLALRRCITTQRCPRVLPPREAYLPPRATTTTTIFGLTTYVAVVVVVPPRGASLT